MFEIVISLVITLAAVAGTFGVTAISRSQHPDRVLMMVIVTVVSLIIHGLGVLLTESKFNKLMIILSSIGVLLLTLSKILISYLGYLMP